MPKTKNAFALYNFDVARILQRPFFKEFNLPIEDDENVLLSFHNVYEKTNEDVTFNGFLKIITRNEENHSKEVIENLEVITRLGDRTVFYEALLERHIIRLNTMQKYYAERFIETEEKIYKENFERTNGLTKRYHEVLNSITALREKISFKVQTLKELFEKDFRKRFFGSRLRQARKAAGLTQRELAERVGFKTYNSIAQYERGLNDPSLPTLFRIATELKCSTDWLLNLK